MYKLVILLCAVVAGAIAEPEPEPKAEPGVALAYGSPYFASAYAAPRPYLAGGYSAPLLYGAALPAAPFAYNGLAPAHYIKKRSVAALPLAPTYYGAAPYSYAYSSPLFASTYAAPIATAPLTAPITYSHFIKKRSVAALPLATSYIAPAAVSHQSRIDYQTTPYIASYAAPYAYPGAYAYSGFPYFYKK